MKPKIQATASPSGSPTREASVLTEAEYAEMLASLQAAEARIAAGEYVVHNSETFVEEMMAIRAAAIAARKV